MTFATTTRRYRYDYDLEPVPTGGYTARFPAIPQISAFGATAEEAVTVAAGTLRGYLVYLCANDAPLPLPNRP